MRLGLPGAGTCADGLDVFEPLDALWVNASGPMVGRAPSAREYHGFARLGGSLYAHGGRCDVPGTQAGAPLPSIAPASLVWQMLSPRCSAASLLSDLVALDPAKMLWAPVAASGVSPSPRYSHGLAERAGMLYVFGGHGGDGAPKRTRRTPTETAHVSRYRRRALLYRPTYGWR